MSFLLWDAQGGVGIASDRRVLRAHEVPLVDDARDLVARLAERLAQAEADAHEARAAARRDGHAEGLRQAQIEGSRQVAQRLLALEEAAQQQQSRRSDDVARLALAVVRKVLGEWPEPQRLAAAAAHAARELAPQAVLKVRVHPASLDTARAHAAREHPLLQGAEWHADATLASGACRIETALGAVDVGPAEQLDRLARAWGAEAP